MSIKHLNKNKLKEGKQNDRNTLLYYMTIPLLRRGFCYEQIQTVATNTNGVEYGVSEVLKIDSLVHVQNFGGWQAVSLGGGVTVMEKREILVGWVTKVCLKCTKKLE